MSNKRTLIIDGNFMCKRMLRDYTFKENPSQDRIGYLTDLSNHITCEIERVASFCDNIIMVKDSHSWRKSIPLKPNIIIDGDDIHLSHEAQDIQYKANRTQTDDRDWSAIFSTFVEFCECLRDHFGIAFINVPGTEGDDCIWGVCKYLRAHKTKTCVYCTDSDISQLVSPSNVILRRIHSKACPEGEIVVDPKFWDIYTKATDTTDPMAIFNFNPTQWAPEQSMLEGKSLGAGIDICWGPYKILKMMMIGSGKDNVPEIFTWKRKTQYRHITDKFVEEALYLTGKTKESITYDDLYCEPFIKSVIINLCHVTGHDELVVPYLDYLYELTIQNRKMNFLSQKEIPEEIQKELFVCIEEQCKDTQADFGKLSKASNILDALHVFKDKIYQQLGI